MISVENLIRINRTLIEKFLPDLAQNFFSRLLLKKGKHLCIISIHLQYQRQ
jgi:hypothetical protein